MFRELEVVAVELLVVTRVSSSSTFGSVFAPVIAERGRKSKRGERSPLSLFAPISRLLPDVTAGNGRRKTFYPEKKPSVARQWRPIKLPAATVAAD